MTEVRNDPLVGKIYRSENQKEISFEDLMSDLLNKNVVYLGENHDNADHHQQQLRIINEFISRGKKPQIGFEFFSVNQTAELMLFVKQSSSPHIKKAPAKAEANLRKTLGWQDRTDEYWKFYFQFIEIAAKHGLSIFGADLPKGIIRRISRQGVEQLTPIEHDFLKSTELDSNDYQQLMHQKFKDAHCGFAHQKMMEKMYQTWKERNDSMAHSIVAMHKQATDQPIIVILGKGHTEHNMGVYERVQFRDANITQANLGFTEISIKPRPLEDYLKGERVGNTTFLPPFEVVWFSQRTSYEDPCERFKAVFQKMKKR